MIRDNREAYYARVAPHIAADPLGFYTRAEAGRRFQARFQTPRAPAAVRARTDNVLRLHRPTGS